VRGNAGDFGRPRRRWFLLFGLLAVPGAAALSIHLETSSTRSTSTRSTVTSALASALAPTRSIEMRIAAADSYRPYAVPRASTAAVEDLPLSLLADLERRGDRSSLFAALMLRGELGAAARELDAAPPGPDRDSDRAALDLALGHADAALGHAAEALAQGPRLGRALWNAALARKRLRLPLGAAALFDRVALLGEAGWAADARNEAARLRATRAEQLDRSRRAHSEAAALEHQHTPMPLESARRHPDIAREALVEALRGATASEAELLAPLADAIDQEQGTTSLGEQARAAARDRRGRPPLSAEYARLVRAEAPRPAGAARAPDAATWLALARRARHAGALDIELGALTHAADKDAAVFDQLDAAAHASDDPWLQAWAARDQASHLLYVERRLGRAERVLTQALELCPAARAAATCATLDGVLAQTLAPQGRPDLARMHIEHARVVAAAAQDDRTDVWLLQNAAEIAVSRDPDAADPVALASAFSEEQALQSRECNGELYGLDFLALAALDINRPDDARGFSDRADSLQRGRCKGASPRLNGSMARARLLQHEATDDEIARLRADVRLLRATNLTAGEAALADHIEGRLLIERRRDEGEALLRRAVAAGDRTPDDTFCAVARNMSLTVLALDAGRRGKFRDALALLASAEDRPAAAGCTLGVAGEDGVELVIASGTGGDIHGAYRSRPRGAAGRIPPVAKIVPAELRAAVTHCTVVDVLARGAYYGRARLLPRELAWRYRSSTARGDRGPMAGARLVITGVEPPAWLRLPALRDEADESGAIVMRGGEATPKRVLSRMGEAAVIEIHAHGLVDVQEPSAASLALSPDDDGDYSLTADRVRGARLPRHPLVLLAACHAGRTPQGDSRWGLADAFLAAGARSVVASTAAMPDSGLSATLSAVTADVRTGRSAAESVRDARLAHPDRDWLNDIVVFE